MRVLGAKVVLAACLLVLLRQRGSPESGPVGIVSLGDLAVEREPDSTLADISAASPDN